MSTSSWWSSKNLNSGNFILISFKILRYCRSYSLFYMTSSTAYIVTFLVGFMFFRAYMRLLLLALRILEFLLLFLPFFNELNPSLVFFRQSFLLVCMLLSSLFSTKTEFLSISCEAFARFYSSLHLTWSFSCLIPA